MATRNYPKTRIYTPDDPEYLYGKWITGASSPGGPTVQKREIWRSTEDEAIAVEVTVFTSDPLSHTAACRFSPAYLRARKARAGTTTPNDPSDAQKGAQ